MKTHGVVAGQSDEPADDLAALAQQTLAGVPPNNLPPEPFACGFDLGALASTSRPPPPPGRSDDAREDTNGRLDLSGCALSAVPAKPRQRATSAPPPSAAALSASLRKTSAPPPSAAALSASLRKRSSSQPPPLVASTQPASAAALLGRLRRAPPWAWFAIGATCATLLVSFVPGDGEAATVRIAAAPTSPSPTAAATPILPAAVIAQSFQSAAPAVGSPARQTRVAAAALPDRTLPHAAPSPALRGDEASEADSIEADSTETVIPPPAPEVEAKSLDSLLDQALSGRAPIAAPSRADDTDSSLPLLPAREDVARVLAELQTRIRFCADGRPGVATAHVTATSNGRITEVRVSGGPASSMDTARCMERVIRQVRFPRFQQPSFRITYPFQI